MSKVDLRFRQVNLDFHTSEHIEGIGSDFDPQQFVSTLQKARVNSITCFARCHHGWMYFDTKAFPERRHPHLSRNLLAEQIEACHANGIRVPIYTTVQWDHFTGQRHPEWLLVKPEDKPEPDPIGFYHGLCVNSPYRDFLKAHVKEILETLPTDGILFDIVQVRPCVCKYCKAGMQAEGMDLGDKESQSKYAAQVLTSFKRDMTGVVQQFNEDCTVFYNAGHVGPSLRDTLDTYTHLELESLPSGGWGYMHFPMTMRYARNLGVDCLGMTGKFHTSWGDFHSFKNQAALEFECLNMLALAGKCSVGDQLHPSGKICQATYDLIGSAYKLVEQAEPWCMGAKAVTEIGVMNPEEFEPGSAYCVSKAAIGATRMLQEGAHQFDIIDSSSDFSKYKLLILPDEITVSKELADRIEKYLADGGAIIATHKSGLNEQATEFSLKSLGLEYKGQAPYSPDYILPGEKIAKGLPLTEHVMYISGTEVAAGNGTEILAQVVVPYFNRTAEHFCSHAHTPSSGKIAYPGIVRQGQAIYFAHPIFTQYNKNAPLWCKKLLINALDLLLPEPLVRIDAPSSTIVTVNEQSAENRWIVHLLHYIPERRGQDFDLIEDVIPLYNLKASVKTDRKVKNVLCAPQGTSLGFNQNGNRVEFTLPRLEGHQMISLNFA